ncbi:MAG: hypothetical protein ACOYBX_07280 [Mycobacterium sp.]|jgi:hypothetical protein
MASLLATVVLAGAAAAAIALAPSATAERPDNCRGTACVKPGPVQNPLRTDFSPELPKGWTNEAQWARPGPAGSNPFGAGPRPPVLAMD